jgi:tRNA pseudouridine38-40 synthase
VRVIEACAVAEDFHARYSARGKTYRYRIFNARYASPFLVRYTHTDARRFDVALMQECARLFVGAHDWTAFSAAQADVETRVRTVTQLAVRELWSEEGRGRLIEITASAEGFLRYMVRSIAGTLLEVGRGQMDAAQVARAIESGERSLAGATAPAKGVNRE